MRKSMLILGAIATSLAAGLTAAPAMADKPTGEQQLAKLLEGRFPGKPVSCISFSDQQDMKVIDKTAIVFGFGQVLYVNRPTNPGDLDSDKVLVTKSSTGELCNVDIVNLRDRTDRMPSGFISLGQFVPYTRAPKGN